MEKIKAKIFKLSLVLKKVAKKFPITIATIIILTLICALDDAFNMITYKILKNIIIFCITFANGALLIESISNKEKNNIVYYVMSAIISISFTKAISSTAFQTSDIIGRIYICYMIIIPALILFFNYKNRTNKEYSFNEYITSIFINIFKASLVYVILAIGIAMITSIFVFLILEGKTYSIVTVAEILILGLYYVPNLIYALCNVEDEIKTKFSKFVVKYVLETLVIIAFVIIYIYILKIILTRQMPSNQIFRILAYLFILGFPIWTMTKTFNENTLIDKINKWLPALFIPFIALQVYSIGVRISNYGMTTSRYLCVMLIVFEIIYTIIYFKNNKKIENSIIVFVIITLISTVVPYINMYKVSEYSQIHNLKLIEKNIYTNNEKNKIVGAYNYLKQNSKYLETLPESELEKILSVTQSEDKYSSSIYDNLNRINLHTNNNKINIEGYKRLYAIETNNYYSQASNELKNIQELFSNLEINLYNNTSYYENSNSNNESEKIYINILNNINEYINYKKRKSESNLNKEFENMNEIELNNERKLIIQDLSFSYDENTKEVSSYSLTGYILEK